VRNAVSGTANDVIMLAKHHMRPVLLDPTGRHERYCVTAFDGAAHLNPGHIGHIDRIR
jgi:hypothetical protein